MENGCTHRPIDQRGLSLSPQHADKKIARLIFQILLLCLLLACDDSGDRRDSASPTGPIGEIALEADDALHLPNGLSPDQRVVNVYWLRGEQLAAGGRVVEMPALAGAAMAAMIDGPTPLEAELGMTSSIPAGTEVLGLMISEGVATVDLSSEFESRSLGMFGETGLILQVVFALTQFPTVDSVNITIEGEPRDGILSHGFEANGLTRADWRGSGYESIVIETPYPGQVIASPLAVRGFATQSLTEIAYEMLLPPDGATGAAGTASVVKSSTELLGRFSFAIEFDATRPGQAELSARETVMRDSERAPYTVPLDLAP